MSESTTRRPARLALTCITALALAGTGIVVAQPTTGMGEPHTPVTEDGHTAFAGEGDRISIFVELDGTSAADVFVQEREAFARANASRFGRDDLQAEAERAGARVAFSAAGDLLEVQQNLIQELASRFDARVLFNARFVANGIAVSVAPGQLAAIQQLAGVKSVSPLAEHEPAAASSLDFTGVRSFWGNVAPDLGLRGANIGVGVIDSGIDHMHTAFGGPGGSGYKIGVTTTTPYPVPPEIPSATSFPTPKVVWGFDFAGDAYNAGGTTDAARIPVPDPNPMDGGTHGTSVASLIGAFGVNADGSTYTGAYNRDLPVVESPSIRISPGYAPEAPLYALRVFGISGSSSVVSAALDAAAAIYLWQSDTSIPWDGQVSTTVTNAAGQPTVVNYSIPQPPASPRLRIVNLSLGSNNGDIEEVSAQAAQRAADAGLIVVLSAGNAYDTYYITGAPGVASASISVAASINNQIPGAVANAPVNGAQPALMNVPITQVSSAAFSSAVQAFPTTPVVYGSPNLADYLAPTPMGYTPADPGELVTLKDPLGVDINLFTLDDGNLVVSLNPAANNIYAGNVVLLDRGSVGFHQKGLAAERAGAVGAIIVNSTAAFGGMAANPLLPSIAIPSGMITQAVGGQLTDGGALNTGVNRTVAVRPSLTLQLFATTAANQDTMAIYSSRGPRRSDDGIKPDISAPAEVVTVASSGSGNGVAGFNGTSSAAPHTSGAMALLRQLNPTWTNFELKALLLNGASNDIFLDPSTQLDVAPSGIQWGISRQGVGRWDLSAYAGGGTKVIMFGEDPLPTGTGASRRGNINVSYGVVDVVEPVSIDRNVIVRNKGTTAQTFSLGFDSVATTPGVSFSFPDGNLLTVGAQSERSIRVRMNANPVDMRHAREPGMRPFQFVGGNPLPRQFMNEAAGYVTLTPSGGNVASHRLTVQAFPRRASDVSVAGQSIALDQPQTIELGGIAFNTGTATAFANPPTFDQLPEIVDLASYAKPLELAYTGEALDDITPMQQAADIQYVGVISDFANRPDPFGASPAVLQFGIAAFGEFDTPQAGTGTEFFIEIDLNNDGVAERAVRQIAFVNSQSGTAQANSNIMLPAVSVAPPFSSVSSTGWSLNVFPTQYSNIYNNSVLTVPVNIAGAGASLGLTIDSTAFRYRVTGIHRGISISQTPWLFYDVAAPGLVLPGVSEPSLFPAVAVDGSPVTIEVETDSANVATNATQGVLMLYPMNAKGDRAEVVPFTATTAIFADGFESDL